MLQEQRATSLRDASLLRMVACECVRVACDMTMMARRQGNEDDGNGEPKPKS
jgi:hypothetical protein